MSHSPPAAVRSGAGPVSHARVDELEKRLRLVEDELEAAGGELHRLNEERDFYRQLLGDPKSRVTRRGED